MLALAGALIASVLIARSVTQPIRRLQAGARRIAQGDREFRLEETSSDEIGQLAKDFNRMTATLAASEAEIHLHVATLEQRVAEKTKEVAQHAAELERANEELERFAYVASHDLQEPLRMVAGYTKLLGKRYSGKLDSNADEFIAFAVDGATRMQALINDLLSYARVTRKAREFEAIEGEKVVDRALANLHRSLADSGATVTRDPLPTLRGDATQLVQVFQN